MADERRFFKTVYTVTVLSEGSPVPSDLDFEYVLREMSDGEFIGDVVREAPTEIPCDKLMDELTAIGNDGSFFGCWDD